MSTVDAPKSEDEEFKPLDPKTYQWKYGGVVRNQVALPDLWVGSSFPKAQEYDWANSSFTITVDRPLTYQALFDLVKNATKQFGEKNESLKQETPELQQAIRKDVFTRLFVYWYRQFEDIKLIDHESFAKAKAQVDKNGNGNADGGLG
jgi:hypothetical protein